jgi:hypothetical protein
MDPEARESCRDHSSVELHAVIEGGGETNLLHDDGVVEVTLAQSSILFRRRDTQQTHLSKFLQRRAR